MPVLGGLEATKFIRASGKKYANIPIVAMTANVMDEDREACIAAGMDGFITQTPQQADASERHCKNYGYECKFSSTKSGCCLLKTFLFL